METYRKMIPDAFFCPISGEIMLDAVIHISTGISYQRSSIENSVFPDDLMENQRLKSCIYELLTKIFKEWKAVQHQKLVDISSKLHSDHKEPIQIMTMYKKEIQHSMDYRQSVFYLKHLISEVESIPIDQFRLVYNGKQMEDSKTLVDYKYEKGTPIYMILRLRGGMFHSSSGRFNFEQLEDTDTATQTFILEFINKVRKNNFTI